MQCACTRKQIKVPGVFSRLTGSECESSSPFSTSTPPCTYQRRIRHTHFSQSTATTLPMVDSSALSHAPYMRSEWGGSDG